MIEIIGGMIFAIIIYILGVILFLVSAGFIIYYYVTKKGKLVLSIIGLCLSVLLMGGGFSYLLYQTISKVESKKQHSRDLIQEHYSLSEEQKEILETKTFEECDSEDINLIMRASACIFRDEDEKAKYEPKLKNIYTEYFKSIGYDEAQVLEYYNQVRSGV